MTRRSGEPVGRAARLRLRRRLAVARRGADMLEKKLGILTTLQAKLAAAEQETAGRWPTELARAEEWLLRSRVLGGERMTEAAASDMAPAEVTFTWNTVMGLRYPSGAVCAAPTRSPTMLPPGTTALALAEPSYRDALRAAAEHAAAATAVRRVADEVRRTRRRVRALRRHWIPRLEEQLARCELALAQIELEEAVRRRRASGRTLPS